MGSATVSASREARQELHRYNAQRLKALELAQGEPQANVSDLVVALVTWTAIVFGAGFWTSQWLESRKPPPAPVVKVVEVRPLTQWKCDGQERREYIHACVNRLKSARIGPKD